MLELFTSRDPTESGLIHLPEFSVVQRAYQRELQNIENYYHSRVYAVRNNHLLVRLLTDMTVPMEYDLGRYTNVATTRAPYIAAALKMTTPLHTGELHSGAFYGEGSSEVIVLDMEYFNPFDAYRNWERISAVRVLKHCKSDLGLLLPNGRRTASGEGISVISVNIPLLAVQYRAFCFQQLARMKDHMSLLGAAHFVHMHVIPNMLYGQTDLCMLNRLGDLFYDRPRGNSYAKHPFNVIQYTPKVDTVLKTYLKKVENTGMRYQDLLNSVPCITDIDMQSVLELPAVPGTRQIQWALWLSRLDVMELLIDIGGARGVARNRTQLGNLQRRLERLSHDNPMSNLLPNHLYRAVTEQIQRLCSI